MRLVFGTLDLPDTDLAPRLLERYVMHQPDYDDAQLAWLERG